MKSKEVEISRLCFEIEKQGWSFSDRLFGQEVLNGLESRLTELEAANLLTPAKIGRFQIERLDEESRGDLISWIDDEKLQPAEKLFFSETKFLEEILQQRFFLPIHNREFHYAIYPAGTRYEKHVDQHRGAESRQISCVIYLNRGWKPADGGRLRIYKENSPLDIDAEIDPIFGRSVFFLSSRIAHEVLVSQKSRRSITGWLRR